MDLSAFNGTERTGLALGEYLKMGEFLYSPDGLWKAGFWSWGGDPNFFVFRNDAENKKYLVYWNYPIKNKSKVFAIMQKDGNFCIYEGEDPSSQKGLIWQTNTAGKGVNDSWKFVVQYDGNICVNDLSKSYGKGRIKWQSGYNTGLSKEFRPFGDGFDLDPKNGTIKKPSEISVYSNTIDNESDVEQSSKVTIKYIKSKEFTTKTAHGAKVGIKVSAKFGLPFISKAGIEISGEYTYNYEKNETVKSSTEETYEIAIRIPPRSGMHVTGVLTNQPYEVPYTMRGHYILQDGNKAYGELKGMFSGSESTTFKVYYQPVSLPRQLASSAVGTQQANAAVDTPQTTYIGEERIALGETIEVGGE